MPETIIDFIRHGEPVGGSKYRGHNVDDPLSEKGWQQMWSAVGENIPWQLVISSPLKRCLEFSAVLGEKHDLPVMVEDRFKEIGFGSWEGRTRADIRQKNLKEYDDFYHDPVNHRPAGAEDLSVFLQRTGSAFSDLLEQYAGRHCLVVAHAGVIRALVSTVLGAGADSMYRIKIDNAGLSRVISHSGRQELAFVNRPNL